MSAARKNLEFLQHDFTGEFQPRKNLEKTRIFKFERNLGAKNGQQIVFLDMYFVR